MASWDLKVAAGNAGGAPPHRVWRASSNWTVQVTDSTTIAELMDKIKETTGRSDLSIGSFSNHGEGAFQPDRANPAQTVKDAGLTKDSLLGFHNGRMD
eukprot:TRINITY_DN1817_c0_g1_i1.p1 TRINITY_DN1817_c0_g1~~TRINITY_DN1817_c0_g1_i1.p1  ORF type:complete len:115 (-),score=25.48 TRINITY_DN1817_c0_g1_i1:113-406(-)